MDDKLYLVDKQKKTRVEGLSEHYKNILLDSDKFGGDNIGFVNYLHEIKNKYWIECNCNSGKAFLVIYSTKYHISVRCKERNEHKHTCLFFIKNIEFSVNNHLLPLRKMRTYDLYPANQLYNSEEAQVLKNDKKSNTSKLGQALYTFYIDSECNIHEFGRKRKSLKNQLHDFSKAAGAPCNKITKDLPLGRIYRYSMSEKSLEYAKSDLSKINFPYHLRPFILFSTRSAMVSEGSFSIAREIDKKWQSYSFDVKSNIKKPSSWISFKNSNPFFLLTTLMQNFETGEYEFKDAFAMPICSLDNIMPVESIYERWVLHLLIQTISCYSNPEDYHIEKPLLAIKTSDYEIYRPDFIIKQTSESKVIFIEVLGSTTEEYLAQKELITNRASKYCDAYLSIKGYKFSEEKPRFLKELSYHLGG